MLKAALLSFAFAGISWSSHTSEAERLRNVSYQLVQGLSYQTADRVVSYGPSDLQFIEGWQSLPEDYIGDLVFIHGGCWLSAYDIAHSRPFTSALRDEGFNIWSIEYRRTGDEGGGWPESFYDVQNAIQHLADANLIDVQNTLVIGHSAGGHLGLLAAQQNAELKGIVGLAAIADLDAYASGDNGCQRVTEQFMEGIPDEHPEAYKIANPKLHPMHRNTHLIYSVSDPIVPPEQADGLDGVELIELDNVGHFDFIHPGSTAWLDIIETLKLALKNEQ